MVLGGFAGDTITGGDERDIVVSQPKVLCSDLKAGFSNTASDLPYQSLEILG